MKTFEKDPDAVLDYYWDWQDWLSEGDSIDSIEFISTANLVVDEYAIIGDKVMALISGGDEGAIGTVTCRVTTAGPPIKIDDRTARFQITER